MVLLLASRPYEAKIKNMGNASRDGGEYYTPRPLIRATGQGTRILGVAAIAVMVSSSPLSHAADSTQPSLPSVPHELTVSGVRSVLERAGLRFAFTYYGVQMVDGHHGSDGVVE
jgi:hypothetical protein